MLAGCWAGGGDSHPVERVTPLKLCLYGWICHSAVLLQLLEFLIYIREANVSDGGVRSATCVVAQRVSI